MSIEAMKQVIELYDKHCYNNDYGGIEFNKKHGYKFIEAIEALRTAIQQAEAKTDEPVNPTHWRAVLSEPQRPHELRKHLHTVLFREWDDAESWVASKLDFEGWQYTLEPLYTHPAPDVPDDVVRDAERYRFIRDADVSDDLIPDIALYAMESLDEYIDAAMLTAAQAQKGGECLPIRGNQVTCSRGTGGCGIQHKGGD